MTPQEALAQALRTYADRLDDEDMEPLPDGWERGEIVSVALTGKPDDLAAAILDALRENGHDVRPTSTITIVRERRLYEDGMEHGAQQEREPYIDLAEGKPVDKQRYLTDPVYHAIVYRLMRPAQQERERLRAAAVQDFADGNIPLVVAAVIDRLLADPDEADR